MTKKKDNIDWSIERSTTYTLWLMLLLFLFFFLFFCSFSSGQSMHYRQHPQYYERNVRKHVHTYEKKRRMNWSMWTNNCSEFISVVMVGEKRKEKMRMNGLLLLVCDVQYRTMCLTKKQMILNSKDHWMNEWMLTFFLFHIHERERERVSTQSFINEKFIYKRISKRKCTI